jgi:hypothetical protein
MYPVYDMLVKSPLSSLKTPEFAIEHTGSKIFALPSAEYSAGELLGLLTLLW